MRRTLIIIAAVVLLLGIGVGVYFLFFAHKANLIVQPGTTLPGADNSVGNTSSTVPSIQELGVPSPGAGTDVAPRLVRISDKPVALGSVAVFVPGHPAVMGKGTASTTVITPAVDPDVRVEYVERESGNVYGYQAHGRTLTRLSNKTLPGVQEATWLSDGSQAYVRFLATTDGAEHTNTYALPSTGDGGYFLEQDLSQVLAKGTSTLATLFSTTDGSSLTVSTPSGANVRTFFSSVLSSIRVAVSGANYVATTKGSATTDGYSFLVDPSGTLTRVLGPLQGLATLPSPSGRYLLYSYLDNGKESLAILDMTTHTATRLPLGTLAEKCTWASDDNSIYCGIPTSMTGTLPDDWYQGAASFSDRLWKIDLSSRVATLVIDPKQAGNVDIDMVGLSVDRTNDILIFTNKLDSALYAYDL